MSDGMGKILRWCESPIYLARAI